MHLGRCIIEEHGSEAQVKESTRINARKIIMTFIYSVNQ